MKSPSLVMRALALAATPAMAQQVTIDDAHHIGFSSVETFQYVETRAINAQNQLMADRITGMLKKQLTAAGLNEVTENPDLVVTHHDTSKENTTDTTMNTGFSGHGGFCGGWGGWGLGGVGSSTTTETTYTEGTLIFDAYQPGDTKMVWRGTGTVTVKEKPEKQAEQVDEILTELGETWHEILAGQGE